MAGPIKRYTQFLPSLAEGSSRFRFDDIGEGMFRIATGFAKKVIVADNLTLYIDANQPDFDGGSWAMFSTLARVRRHRPSHPPWIFSGYSDIAIGVARLLGITLPENFQLAYLARNLQDFLGSAGTSSLSTWVRDYIYIPLGGSRHGLPRAGS